MTTSSPVVPGTAAGLGIPIALAADGAGNVYVADARDATIFLITPTPSSSPQTWSVYNLAGTGVPGDADGSGDPNAPTPAQLSDVSGLALDGAGNLYAADSSNNAIRLLTSSGDRTQAGNWTVTTLPLAWGQAPGQNGEPNSGTLLTYPTGIAVDGAGNLYVNNPTTTNTDCATVLKLVPTPSVSPTSWVASTLVGNALQSAHTTLPGAGTAANLENAWGMAVDLAANPVLSPGTQLASGNVYVTDQNSLSQVAISAQNGGTMAYIAGPTDPQTDGPITEATFHTPYGMAVDTAGHVFVADTGHNTIRMITPGTPWTVSTIAGDAANNASGSNDGSGSMATFSNPQGVAVDAAGNIYVADTGNSTIRMLTLTPYSDPTQAGNWNVTTIAGMADTPSYLDGVGTNTNFNLPGGLAVDGSGRIYVADTGNDVIRLITPSTSNQITTWTVTTLAGTGTMTGWLDGPGNTALFQAPTGVAVDASGTVYVADTSNDAIRILTLAQGGDPTVAADWSVVTLAGNPQNPGAQDGPGPTASFASPLGIAVDPAGNLYVADNANALIRMLTPPRANGTIPWTVSTVVGTAAPLLQTPLLYPTGVAVDPTTGGLFMSVTNAILEAW